MNQLSVIIPSKTASNLIPCIDAIIVNDFDCRIVVVDDGVDWPGPPAKLRYEDSCIPGEKPFIFSRNVNLGIRNGMRDCDVRSFVILNDDAILKTPGGFSLLQKAAEAHPEYGVIAATTNIVGNINQQPRGIGLREDPAMVCFVCVLIPRRTIDKVGLLDERYCLDYGCEDGDYCESVRRAGLKIGIHDGCFVDHGSLRSSFRGDPTAPKAFAQNQRLFNEKWGIA